MLDTNNFSNTLVVDIVCGIVANSWCCVDVGVNIVCDIVANCFCFVDNIPTNHLKTIWHFPTSKNSLKKSIFQHQIFSRKWLFDSIRCFIIFSCICMNQILIFCLMIYSRTELGQWTKLTGWIHSSGAGILKIVQLLLEQQI